MLYIKLIKITFLCFIQSLSGHTSPVDSVKFNSSEELVVAGSQSGTMKIYDLEPAKSKLLLYQFRVQHWLQCIFFVILPALIERLWALSPLTHTHTPHFVLSVLSFLRIKWFQKDDYLHSLVVIVKRGFFFVDFFLNKRG